jgi:hypothetical protein
VKKAFAVVFVVLVSALAGVAQTDPTLDTGLKPYGSYHGGDLDSVSLTNGNLTLHITLGSYPQRGALSYSVVLNYNNKGWSVVPNCNSFTGVCRPFWTWNGQGVTLNRVGGGAGVPVSTSFEQLSDDQVLVSWAPAYKGALFNVFNATTTDGSTHQLANNSVT